LRGLTEAGRKLKQDATELVRIDQRRYPLLELFHLLRSPVAFLMRKLLPGFHRELEVGRRPFRPILCCLRSAWPVKRGVDFDGVEVAGIEFEFVDLRERIKDSGP